MIIKELVIRAANAEDGRAQTICLTLKGEKFVPELAKLADQNDQECFDHLFSKDQEKFKHILYTLSAIC